MADAGLCSRPVQAQGAFSDMTVQVTWVTTDLVGELGWLKDWEACWGNSSYLLTNFPRLTHREIQKQ